jgi:hypothetical protein
MDTVIVAGGTYPGEVAYTPNGDGTYQLGVHEAADQWYAETYWAR